jgi:hypothetical protein
MVPLVKTITNLKGMRTFLLFTLLTAILFIPPGYAFSQTKMKLSGTVSDSTKPLALVTVRIFKKINQPPLQTTLSKENGSFQFNKPDTGNYILSFTHTGFAEKQVAIIVGRSPVTCQSIPATIHSNRYERSESNFPATDDRTVG